MSTWMSEKEFRQSGADSAGVTINVEFLKEIKTDFGFRDVLNEVYYKLVPHHPDSSLLSPNPPARVSPRQAAELLGELRDALETYFALEEFYGYFHKSAIENPCVSQKAFALQGEHEILFIHLNRIVEMTEKIVYHESGELTLDEVASELELFCIELARHEHAEMELMMKLCNEDFGVGD